MPILYGCNALTLKRLLPETHLIPIAAGVRISLPEDKELLSQWWQQLYPYWRMGNAGNNTLVRFLAKKRLTVSVAESCTGGLIASQLTDVPGASAVFEAGLTAYTPAAKSEFLGLALDKIPPGAVSKHLTLVMAESIRLRCRSSLGLATTGVLGPKIPAPGLFIGQIYIAVVGLKQMDCRMFYFSGDRETIKQLATTAALNFLFSYTVRWIK